MGDYKKYKVWEKARCFVSDIYRISRTFPEDERFGIISQIRRASVSITANIAEGSARNSDKEFSRFLSISLASAAEVECLLIICCDLKFITDDDLDKLITQVLEIQRMLASFRVQLNQASS